MTVNKRPDILLINTHDSGRYFGCYGVATVNSPHLDSLAATGVLFENMIAASPICSPSRGAMVTGRWPQRNGLLGLTHHGFRLNSNERHAAQIFRDSGYETVLFHFQHVAEKHEWPGLGFDRYLAQSRDEEEPVYPNMARPAQEVALAFGRFLEGRTTEKPYFAQINFNETHTPFEFGGVTADRAKGVTVPGWIEKDGEAEQHFALLQGSVAALDRGIGILLEALKANGRANDTLIVFATDHGLEAVRDKWSCYESGLGIAAMLRYPAAGVTGGRRIREPVSNVDLLPTMLGLAGIDLPPDLDGLDLTTVVRGQQSADAERPIFGIYHNSGIRSVRVGNWKLIRNFSAEPYRELAPATLLKRKPLQPRPHAELYNLSEDPDELTNLIGSHPEQAALLERHLAVWMQQVKDPAYIC